MAHRPFFNYTQAVGAASVTNARVTPVGVRAIRLASTTACWVTIDDNGGTPASATVGFLLNGGVDGEIFGVCAGDQVSVIQASAAGTLSICEMTNA